MFTATDVRRFQMETRLSLVNFLEKKLRNDGELKTSFIVVRNASHEQLQFGWNTLEM